MQADLTDITLLIDRSGSMSACKADMEGGLNAFIDKQKADSGRTLLSLVQFDNVYEAVYTAKPIADVPAIVLSPRGGTALLDALGRTIVETGARLASMSEADRPGFVTFLIVTDGEENASKEYTNEKIAGMIAHQSDVYAWTFSYLGAGHDSFSVAKSVGIPLAATSNYRTAKAASAFGSASSMITRGKVQTLTGTVPTHTYTTEETTSMN